jgi:PKD repeat protein
MQLPSQRRSFVWALLAYLSTSNLSNYHRALCFRAERLPVLIKWLLYIPAFACGPMLYAGLFPTITAISPTNALEGSTVALQASISAPDSTGPLSYHWVFEDGSSSTNESPLLTLSYFYQYVYLTVADDSGVTSLPFYQKIDIKNDILSVVAISPSEGKQGERLIFAAQVNHPRSESIQEVEWTLPDGSKSSLRNPSYLFSKPGDYPVSATVEDFAFEFVYRNDAEFSSSPEFYPSPAEFGDEIVLGGTNRFLQHLELLYYGDLAELNAAEREIASGKVRIYRNDGIKLSEYFTMPGTVIWESADFKLKDGYTWKLLDDINVEVPDSFTWTIEFSGLPQIPGKQAGIVFAHSNTHSAEDIGYSFDDFWQKADATWLPYDFEQHPIANFGTTATVLTSEIAASSATFTNIVHIGNLPPQIAVLNVPTTALVDHYVTFSTVATDPGNDGISFEWDFGDGSKAAGGTVSNRFSEVGNYTISLNAADEFGASASVSATLEITADQNALRFSSVPTFVAREGIDYVYPVETIQPATGQVLTLNAVTLPKWLRFTDEGNGKGRLEGVPDNRNVGAAEVSLQVSDGTSSAVQSFTIFVANVNNAPAISTIPDRAIQLGSRNATFLFSVADIDSSLDSLNIIVTSSNEDVVRSSDLAVTGTGSERTLTMTTVGAVGDAQITISVSDGFRSSETSFTVSVTELPFFQITTNSTVGGHLRLRPPASDWRFPAGSIVEVTAISDIGYSFAGWFNGIAGSNNPATITVISNTVIAASFKDVLPPLVTIASPLQGPSQNQVVQFSGLVEDNGLAKSARWYRDGTFMDNLSLVQGRFLVDGIRLNPGSNRFKVVAEDQAGNHAESEVQVYWSPGLVLSVGDAPAQAEGHKIKVPVFLSSSGQVGGMHFVLHYSSEFLTEPVFTWSSVVSLSQNSVDASVPGAVGATFSFAQGQVAVGVQTIGSLEMRARSVPFGLTTEVEPEVIDISNGSGDPIKEGIETSLGLVEISPRAFTGDINGNGRLDIGDAALLQRLILGVDAPRSWDLGLNDLNGNNALDSGDVTRLLRAVVGLSPQPFGATLENISNLDVKNRFKSQLKAEAQLLPELISGKAGDTVTVQIRIQNLANPISGAFIRLRYPTAAFELVSAQSYDAGILVPNDAVKIWNSLPAEGVISFAASSGKTWTNQNGILAEVSFKINSGVPDQTAFQMNLEQVEVSGNSFESPSLRVVDSLYVSGVAYPPPQVRSLKLLAGGTVELNVSSEMNQSLLVEFSEDLKQWAPLATLPGGSGIFSISAGAEAARDRYYRLKALVPLNPPIVIKPATNR